jgi:hypothetical protein
VKECARLSEMVFDGPVSYFLIKEAACPKVTKFAEKTRFIWFFTAIPAFSVRITRSFFSGHYPVYSG